MTRRIGGGRLGHCSVLSVLWNPGCAGAYVFGRSLSSRSVGPDGTIRTRTTRVSREHWPILIHDHHPAYIRWETFLTHERQLADNCTQHGARPPREADALLQGMANCASRGRATSDRYKWGQA